MLERTTAAATLYDRLRSAVERTVAETEQESDELRFSTDIATAVRTRVHRVSDHPCGAHR
jgi:hypothetical protein